MMEPPMSNSKAKEKKTRLTKTLLENLLKKINLSGIRDWDEEDKKEVKKLIKEFGSLFVLNNLDLGRTYIIKHTIKLTDYNPFKEGYQRIPPHQYEEVGKC